MGNLRNYISSLILIIIGFFAIRQKVPYGNEWCFGLENNLAFIGLLVLYIIAFITIISLELKNWRSKKWLHKWGSIIITVGLILSYVLLKNQESFKADTFFIAESEKTKKYKLSLRKNGTYYLVGHYMHHTCYFQGEYVWKNDTLSLSGYGKIDSQYLFDKGTEKLIPRNSEQFDTLKIKKHAHNTVYN